jgi:hypothetical protein
VINNFTGDIARAIEFALTSRADAADDRRPFGRYARILAPRVEKAIEVLLPFAMEKLKAPIDGEALVRRNAMRRELDEAVIAALREEVFEERPIVGEMDGAVIRELVESQGLAPGVWDLWTSIDHEFWDLRATFPLRPGRPLPTFGKLPAFRTCDLRRATWLGARLWRRLRSRTQHQVLVFGVGAGGVGREPPAAA